MNLNNAIIVNKTINLMREMANKKVEKEGTTYDKACESAKQELGINNVVELSGVVVRKPLSDFKQVNDVKTTEESQINTNTKVYVKTLGTYSNAA